MTNDGTNTLTYDNNGNMTSDGTQASIWDGANRLRSHGSLSYAYDGLNNRISQTVNSVVTEYLLDVQPGLTKVIGATTSGNTERYVHAQRGIHAIEDSSGNWTHPAQDGLGSVRMQLDDSLNVDAMRNFGLYGDPFGLQGMFDMPFGFTGEMTDSNGLSYLRARYYNPETGTFTALDPWEGTHDRAMSLNGYSWVEGRVPNWSDPSGLQSPANEEEPIEVGGMGVGTAIYDPFARFLNSFNWSLEAETVALQSPAGIGVYNSLPYINQSQMATLYTEQFSPYFVTLLNDGACGQINAVLEAVGIQPFLYYHAYQQGQAQPTPQAQAQGQQSPTAAPSTVTPSPTATSTPNCSLPTAPGIRRQQSAAAQPLLGQTMQLVAAPLGIEVCTNQEFTQIATGRTVGEVDIELNNMLVEVKQERNYSPDNVRQLARTYHNPLINYPLDSKQVIFYAPQLSKSDVGKWRRRALETANDFGSATNVIFLKEDVQNSTIADLAELLLGI